MQKEEEEEEEEEEKENCVDYFMCPSFSTYSSAKLVNIADQVTRDYLASQNDNDIDVNDDDNFEFVAFQREASDEVFFDGYQAPVFPIFNRDVVTVSDITGGDDDGGRRSSEEVDSVMLELPMRKLLISDEDRRRGSPSSSSSEVDDLDGIPAGTYCVWTPKSAQLVQASPNRCKKSNSTGSSASPSKRWKLLDLLRRSNSDGKNTFVFSKKKEEVKSENSKEPIVSGTSNEFAGKKVAGNGERKLPARVSAQEALNIRIREKRIKENNKRRTYLPYKQHLIGFAAPLNGMGMGMGRGRTFAPF